MEPVDQATHSKDFRGGPVVRTLISKARAAGLIPGQRARTPHASWQKKIEPLGKKLRNNIVTNSVKTLKKTNIHLTWTPVLQWFLRRKSFGGVIPEVETFCARR